ncbi:hypothetical protein NQZ68_034931 [Dissostichus eleginoides]|nr:hypothetical protein NQZ68_034931 [Dissostichus eleginoides]
MGQLCCFPFSQAEEKISLTGSQPGSLFAPTLFMFQNEAKHSQRSLYGYVSQKQAAVEQNLKCGKDESERERQSGGDEERDTKDLNPLQAKRSSGRRRSEPDEAELLRVSRRLVEDAVNRALLQYKQETLQNGGGPNATAPQPPGNTDETKTDTTANSTTDYRK